MGLVQQRAPEGQEGSQVWVIYWVQRQRLSRLCYPASTFIFLFPLDSENQGVLCGEATWMRSGADCSSSPEYCNVTVAANLG